MNTLDPADFNVISRLALFLQSAVWVGLMISSLALTQQQGLFAAFLFLVPAMILSRFATPIANMPPMLQALTTLNPLRHFEVVLQRAFSPRPWTARTSSTP